MLDWHGPRDSSVPGSVEILERKLPIGDPLPNVPPPSDFVKPEWRLLDFIRGRRFCGFKGDEKGFVMYEAQSAGWWDTAREKDTGTVLSPDEMGLRPCISAPSRSVVLTCYWFYAGEDFPPMSGEFSLIFNEPVKIQDVLTRVLAKKVGEHVGEKYVPQIYGLMAGHLDWDEVLKGAEGDPESPWYVSPEARAEKERAEKEKARKQALLLARRRWRNSHPHFLRALKNATGIIPDPEPSESFDIVTAPVPEGTKVVTATVVVFGRSFLFGETAKILGQEIFIDNDSIRSLVAGEKYSGGKMHRLPAPWTVVRIQKGVWEREGKRYKRVEHHWLRLHIAVPA